MWPAMTPNVMYYQHKYSSDEDRSDLEVGDVVAFEVMKKKIKK